MKGESAEDFLGTFQDRVRYHGAPEQLAYDDAAIYGDWRVVKYCRDLWIKFWRSEANKQNQNHAENV